MLKVEGCLFGLVIGFMTGCALCVHDTTTLLLPCDMVRQRLWYSSFGTVRLELYAHDKKLL